MTAEPTTSTAAPANPAQILADGLENLKRLQTVHRRQLANVSQVETTWEAEIQRAQARADEIRAASRAQADKITAGGKSESDKVKSAARGDTDAIMDRAKAEADKILAAAKAEADTITTAAKSRMSEITDTAKNQAHAVTAAGKADAGKVLDEVRTQRDEAVRKALHDAEPARAAYADGIATIVSTGWATTASLAGMGHETPRRPKSIGSGSE